MSTCRNTYTNGIDIVNIIQEEKNGYLVKSSNNEILFLENLKGYRNLCDKKDIKGWYKDSKKFALSHPLTAFITAVSVFFGLTSF